jgi:AcrR family transcriptional regulator
MTNESKAPPSLTPSQRPTRRTEGVRTGGRSARVIDAVLQAVAEELGRVGYRALRFEDVAALSGVNKTTIYRRWPSKGELVRAAIEALTEEPTIYDTGTLRGDLLALLHDFVARTQTPVGRGIVRIIQTERADPEVAELIDQLRIRNLASRRAPFERAVERGELPPGSDAALLSELLIAPIVQRVVHHGVAADEPFLAGLVDMLVAGARAGAAVRPASP